MRKVIIVHPTKVCSNVIGGEEVPYTAFNLWPGSWHPPHGVLVTCRCGDLGIIPFEGWLSEFLLDVQQITGIKISINSDGSLRWQNEESSP